MWVDTCNSCDVSMQSRCVRHKSRQRFTTQTRRHGAEQLWVDWHHFAKGRGRFDRIHRINRIPRCCVSGGNHPVDPVHPVQSSDQHGSRAFSHMWSTPCLRDSVVNFRPLPIFVMRTPETNPTTSLNPAPRRHILSIHGRLAQWLAHFLHTEGVTGSIPVTPTRRLGDSLGSQ